MKNKRVEFRTTNQVDKLLESTVRICKRYGGRKKVSRSTVAEEAMKIGLQEITLSLTVDKKNRVVLDN